MTRRPPRPVLPRADTMLLRRLGVPALALVLLLERHSEKREVDVSGQDGGC